MRTLTHREVNKFLSKSDVSREWERGVVGGATEEIKRMDGQDATDLTSDDNS